MTEPAAKAAAPSTPEGRGVRASNLFGNTYARLREKTILGRMAQSPHEWLVARDPALMAKIDAATKDADDAALKYVQGAVEETVFHAAGKAWRDAWLEAATLAEAEGVPVVEPGPGAAAASAGPDTGKSAG